MRCRQRADSAGAANDDRVQCSPRAASAGTGKVDPCNAGSPKAALAQPKGVACGACGKPPAQAQPKMVPASEAARPNAGTGRLVTCKAGRRWPMLAKEVTCTAGCMPPGLDTLDCCSPQTVPHHMATRSAHSLTALPHPPPFSLRIQGLLTQAPGSPARRRTAQGSAATDWRAPAQEQPQPRVLAPEPAPGWRAPLQERPQPRLLEPGLVQAPALRPGRQRALAVQALAQAPQHGLPTESEPQAAPCLAHPPRHQTHWPLPRPASQPGISEQMRGPRPRAPEGWQQAQGS